MNRAERHLLDSAVDFTGHLSEELVQRAFADDNAMNLLSLRGAIKSLTARRLDNRQTADLYAQTVVSTAVALHADQRTLLQPHVASWMISQASPLWKSALVQALGLVGQPEDVGCGQSPAIDRPGSAHDFLRLLADVPGASGRQFATVEFYERFLERYAPEQRSRHGVFYTPQAVTAYTVRQVDLSLCDEFDLADGLADVSTWKTMSARFPQLEIPRGADPQMPFIRIMDPAVGNGVFLVEVIDRIHAHVTRQWQQRGDDQSRIVHQWNRYVQQHLLPRICGVDIMLPACAITYLRIIARLAETGYRFTAPGHVAIHLADSLAGISDEVSDLTREADAACYTTPFTVVVGNPPFSGISEVESRWIVDLLKGRSGGPDGLCSYYEVDGQPLNEKKVWLQDDYVKFFRYAHWRIEQAGCGVIGFVTNHGYLDNHVGGHQVCRKWLRDRRSQSLTMGDLQIYCQMLSAIADTIGHAQRIDQVIDQHGGWPAAFHTE